MDISDWTKSEVVQLLEQYIQEPAKPIEELQTAIQRIVGKTLTVNKLRHHLQQFQKETTAYKQHLKEDGTSKRNTEGNNNSTAVEKDRVSAEAVPIDSSSFEQGAQMPREMSNSKRGEMNKIGAEVDHVPDDTEAVGRTSTFRKITARRREELQILKSYQNRRRKKARNVSLTSTTTTADRKKDLKATTDCEGLQQETEKQEVTVASVKFTARPDGTTALPAESLALISAKPSKPRVILTRVTPNGTKCTVLITETPVPDSNRRTAECTVPTTSPVSNRYTAECTLLAIGSTVPISNRNTAEHTLPVSATGPTVPISNRNTAEHTLSTICPTVPISTAEHTLSVTGPTVPISNRNTAEHTLSVSAICPTVPISNRKTAEHMLSAICPTVPISNSGNFMSWSQGTAGRNVDWNSGVTPLQQSVIYGSTGPENDHYKGSEMQGNLSSQQFQSLTTHLDHCLNALRLLRNEVISVHRRIMEGSWESDPGDGEKTLEERLDFINQIYDNLESHAKQLPVSTPMTVQMERLSRFLHDGQIDPHTSELYDKALEASTWMETNNQLLQMYAEFLRTVVGNRRRSIMTDRPISYSSYGLSSSPQSIFEQTLTVVLKDPNIKKIGLVGRYLEKSTLSALVEFKFGQVIDKQYVCLLKMLMVVNSGLPEFVQMIAPHEEWSYLDVGSGQIDIHKESRYLVYRKMSVQANIHLMQTIMPCIDIRNAHTLSYVLNLFAKFSGVFDIKCRVCKKIMKDYLPPLMFDLRCPKNALHESCR